MARDHIVSEELSKNLTVCNGMEGMQGSCLFIGISAAPGAGSNLGPTTSLGTAGLLGEEFCSKPSSDKSGRW